jgi:flagellar hook-associated protein 3 FlgL
MRITFETQFRTALLDISRAAERLDRYTREVSSGKRLHAPSDDPSANAGAIADHNELSALDAYGRSTDSVISRLTVVDSVFADMVAKLTSARTTAAAARNSTLTDVQRESLAGGLEGLRDAVFSNFTTKFHGSFLFSGTETATSPFVRNPDNSISAYQGNTDTSSVDIDRAIAVQVTFDGDAIARGTDTDDVFTVMENLAAAIRAGDGAGIDAGMDGLDRAFERTLQAQTSIGNSQRLLEEQRARLSTIKNATRTRLSTREDANLAESITNMTQAETVYRAALSARARTAQISLLDYLQ